MKKRFLYVAFMALFVFALASDVSGKEVHLYIGSELPPHKSDTIGASLVKLGQQIIANNRYVFETKLTKKDRTWYGWGDGGPNVSNIIWNRVWAKNQTIVVGEAKRDKKFRLRVIATRDPNMVFANGLHVGSRIQVLEQFFGSLRAFQEIDGICGREVGNTGAAIEIYHENGKITELRWNNSYEPYAKEADTFVRKTAKTMGFPSRFAIFPDDPDLLLDDNNRYYRK